MTRMLVAFTWTRVLVACKVTQMQPRRTGRAGPDPGPRRRPRRRRPCMSPPADRGPPPPRPAPSGRAERLLPRHDRLVHLPPTAPLPTRPATAAPQPGDILSVRPSCAANKFVRTRFTRTRNTDTEYGHGIYGYGIPPRPGLRNRPHAPAVTAVTTPRGNASRARGPPSPDCPGCGIRVTGRCPDCPGRQAARRQRTEYGAVKGGAGGWQGALPVRRELCTVPSGT